MPSERPFKMMYTFKDNVYTTVAFGKKTPIKVTFVLQGHRILIVGKTAQNAFEEVFVPAGLEPFAAEASFRRSVAL